MTDSSSNAELIARLRRFHDERQVIGGHTIFSEAADALAAADARIATLEQMDREAGTYVESEICLRTHFTGEPPYVGWKGLGLAMTEKFNSDEAALAQARRDALEEAAKVVEDWDYDARHTELPAAIRSLIDKETRG